MTTIFSFRNLAIGWAGLLTVLGSGAVALQATQPSPAPVALALAAPIPMPPPVAAIGTPAARGAAAGAVREQQPARHAAAGRTRGASASHPGASGRRSTAAAHATAAGRTAAAICPRRAAAPERPRLCVRACLPCAGLRGHWLGGGNAIPATVRAWADPTPTRGRLNITPGRQPSSARRRPSAERPAPAFPASGSCSARQRARGPGPHGIR